MRYFIFSDIHGNLEALESVFEVLSREKDCIPVCLGDIVGYGPNPRECIRAIRDRNILSLVGNHDHAAIEEIDISYFNPYAKEAVLWTRSILTESDFTYLRSLPVIRKLGGMTLVHATPCNPEAWNYMFTLFDAQSNFKCFDTQLCFVGHSHHPIIIVQNPNGECWVHPHTTTGITSDQRMIINVGSVGQPRDGNPDAAYAIYDDEQGTVEIFRVKYEIRKTQEKMKRHGLPDYLIERLELGR
ncbi:metallophosphoesterase family protein [bacterium]|nr:metallophosphoesterase family protein [candidate division CSSED10-310 bacterium]